MSNKVRSLHPMKRLVIAALLSFSSILIQVPASATTTGCPDSWNIDLSKFPNNPELIEAKRNLGPKMVESQINLTIDKYKGEIGDMPKFLELENVTGQLRFSLMYLYGKSEVETSWKVEVKDCANPGFFKFKHTFSENLFSQVYQTTAAEFSQSNETLFYDFKKQQTFSEELSKANLKSQEYVDKRRSNANAIRSPLLTVQVFELLNGTQNLLKFPGYGLSLQTLTPDCLKPSKLMRGFSELTFGKKCKFAWSILQRVEPASPTNQDMKLVMFESFTIDTSLMTSTITCIKDKATKKITSVSPKCPAGYKKK